MLALSTFEPDAVARDDAEAAEQRRQFGFNPRRPLQRGQACRESVPRLRNDDRIH